ncbi:MAG: hypothetical protein QX199_13155, partial [Methylococcaceae bacterium]
TATTAVLNVNDLPTGGITITGIVQRNEVLTVSNTLVDADGLGTITYQWQADGVNIGSGASYTLTQAEVGKTIVVIAGYTDNQGTTETKASAATAAVLNTNNLPTGNVTITGIAKQGEVLTAANTLADADGLGAISYQWQAGGVNVGSGASYTLTQAEVGKTIIAIAGYTDNQGITETKASVATAAVLNVNDLPTGNVTVSGIAKQGEVLTAANTLADADGLGAISYQWQADGVNVGSGVGYTLTQAEVGKTIIAIAGYTDNQGTTETKASAATAAVLNVNDLPTGNITVSGIAKQGEVLTAANTLADADGLGVIAYQWQADGVNVGSGASYTLTQAEVGKTIIAIAGYTDNQGTTETKASAATAAVLDTNDLPTGSVTITGIAKQGKVLTASNNLADADGLGAISYQWQANGANIGTGAGYTLTSKEVGKTVTATAFYTDSLGHAESVISAGTGAVAAPTTPGFTINPTTAQKTGENGATADYSIQLNTAPAVNQNVVLTFTSSDTSEGIVNNPTLTFTSANYATPQTLTVQGVDDYLDDGNIPYLVTAKVTTLDVFYKVLTLNAFNLTNTGDSLDKALDLYGDKGGSKSDVLKGGNGADTLHGKDMADNLSGGIGNDTLYGGYGADNLFGNEGDDKLLGEQENDYLDGGLGNDTLDGGDGVDTMIGGAGNDTYYLGYDAADVITDNGLAADVDTVIMPYQLTRYTLPASIEQGTIAPGTQASSLTGNDSNNSLTGNDGNNTLDGAVGRDSLFGGAGNDELLGGTDNDTLDGGEGGDYLESGDGNDSVNGGGGDDEIVGGNGIGDDIYMGGAGIDTVKYASATRGITVSLALGTASGAEIDNDKLNSIENIIGGQAGDKLSGDSGNNVIEGFTGNDTLAGGAGNDTLLGGLGNDSYSVENSGDVVTESSTLATEIDKVNSLISYTLGANLEDLSLSGKAAINGTGNSLNNALTGNAGANILSGGSGADTLTGGLGADQFKFNAEAETGISTATRDSIVDFSHSQRDKINLSAIDANTAFAGNNAFAAPTVGGTFSGVFANPGELYFDKTAHILYGNNDEDSRADFSIQLTGVSSLTAADFVL